MSSINVLRWALVIDDQARAKALQIREFAEQPENLIDGKDREPKIPGNDPRYVVHLNTYRCVFWITKKLAGRIPSASVDIGSFERIPKPVRGVHDRGIVWLRGMGRKDPQAGPGLVNPGESCRALRGIRVPVLASGRKEGVMTHRAETVEVKAGQCRVCGCTERKPCALEFVDEDGEAAAVACTWVNAARTLCSNPNCLAEVPPETLELARHGMNDLL